MSGYVENRAYSERAVPPDFLKLLQGDPWFELRWKRGLVQRMKQLQSVSGSSSAGTGGRFAYRLSNRQRIGNAIRAPQAIVKIVRNGGASSGGELASQLTYLSRDGELTLDEYGPDGDFFVDGRGDIRELSCAWAERWDEAARFDGRSARAKQKTFHIVVSFPSGIDEDVARDAADTFADRFLNSAEFGDTWQHVRAWHTDQAHPHMHLVIDRRGESGRMMQIHPAKDINPSRLRALQVEAAAEHGILLNDTPRVSRGLNAPALSTEEWRAEQRGKRRGRSPDRQAYAELTAGFAEAIVPIEARALRRLSGEIESCRNVASASRSSPSAEPSRGLAQAASFSASLTKAAHSLETEQELLPMEPQTLEQDRMTIQSLSAMSPEELSATMLQAVKDAESLSPRLADENKRAALEAEAGRIKQLFAPYIAEFRPVLAQADRSDGLEPIIRSRAAADETRETAARDLAERADERRDALETRSEPRPPSKTLEDADACVKEAYARRGMNGARAIARIKGGIEATPETRNHWHEQEVRERMRAGDLPRIEAEKEIAELHDFATRTYRAASRAIQRGVSLDATEVYAPTDPVIERQRPERVQSERKGTEFEQRLEDAGRRSTEKRERDENREEHFEQTGNNRTHDDRHLDNTDRNDAQATERRRLSEQELREVLAARERELNEAERKRDRGRDRDLDDSFGLGD